MVVFTSSTSRAISAVAELLLCRPTIEENFVHGIATNKYREFSVRRETAGLVNVVISEVQNDN